MINLKQQRKKGYLMHESVKNSVTWSHNQVLFQTFLFLLCLTVWNCIYLTNFNHMHSSTEEKTIPH